MKLKTLQSSLIAAGLLALGSTAPNAWAEDGRTDWRQDTREIRQDRHELRDDYRELQRDRADYARARAAGDVQRMNQERREIRQDMAEIRRDKAELRRDLRERHQDRRERRGEHRDQGTAPDSHGDWRRTRWQGDSAGLASGNGSNASHGMHRGWQVGRGNPQRG